MSTDHRQRAIDASADIGQVGFGRFQANEEFVLDCEDCVEYVTVTGQFDDAKAFAHRHIETRLACEDVVVRDPDTGADVAIVSEADCRRLDQDHGGTA